jgi:putative endonuclease
MYYIYVLKSLKDGKLYVGQAKDLTKRFNEHNSHKVESTKLQTPLKLLYYEACNIFEDAVAREKDLKTGFGRAYLNRRLSDINN